MGFKKVKEKVIECLRQGNVLHEQRNRIDVKNLLAMGFLSTDDLIHIIARSKGHDYVSSKHHLNSKITVHIIRTQTAGRHWYIKWYFIEPNAVFISVHN
ncbi:hypothetical protein [Glaciecola sp. KUL10]|uniref:hypothetical protein n=1 Tax=Glaciecola sp. (strain KUL10) TaxID=2161813 RepID=UPI000D784AAD|nr:hypothetical protein [Glaciecola sp. KUL10]GBL04874.1 hypothetical protein KUL10_21890 [Glaciecola sp. KUL10]